MIGETKRGDIVITGFDPEKLKHHKKKRRMGMSRWFKDVSAYHLSVIGENYYIPEHDGPMTVKQVLKRWDLGYYLTLVLQGHKTVREIPWRNINSDSPKLTQSPEYTDAPPAIG